MTPRLRPMTLDDIDPAVTAILADDWGDRRAWFEFTLRNDACHSMVADIDGEVVGTGVATVNGPVAWVGTIWVARDHRRRGLGRALTDAVVDIATANGARTLLLVATDRGRPLYERSGFEVQTWYRTFEAPGLGGGDAATGTGIRAFRAADVDAIAALDHVATGEDRRSVLEELATPAGTRVLDTGGGELGGFVIRAPWGGGATVAPRLDDALSIVEARRRASTPDKRVRCGILLENGPGAEALERAGWTEAWRAPRLVRGAPLTWHPDQIWGQFNHAMG
ncbi:MAG TPA: GNAT family N-acetyltransferase [Candidatus Limnocylindrales bacterium]|nr:GNAT family N-acetyltransferase [Candidatus Limnocylindrales bacterium]